MMGYMTLIILFVCDHIILFNLVFMVALNELIAVISIVFSVIFYLLFYQKRLLPA